MATIEILTAGYCSSFRCLARRSDPWTWGRFPATFGLIRTSGGSTVLFDTGYSRHVAPAMRRFPFPLYRRLLPIVAGPDAVESLHARGIEPGDVETIVVSHFHPDHIGGLRDFPRARFVCSRAAWNDVRGRTGFSSLGRGFVPGLVPADFKERIVFAEDLSPESDSPWPGARVFESGSERFVVVPLEGHAAGHLGLVLARDDGRNVLFAGDAVWRLSCIDDRIGPHPIAMTIQHDRGAYERTIDLLARMKRDDPTLIVVAAHDPADGSP